MTVRVLRSGKKRMKFMRVYFALLGLLLSSLFNLHHCSFLIPTQYHCVTELQIRSLDTDVNKFDLYLVDEYVDLVSDRSSIKLEDEQGKSEIYYNEFLPVELVAGRRRFMSYNIADGYCRYMPIIDWKLNNIRNIILRLLPSGQLTKELCDIALGPSGLLLAIEETLEDFRFVSTEFSRDRLIEVDVYERMIGTRSVVGKTLTVTVRILSQIGGKAPKEMTLAGVARSKRETDVSSISVCEIDSQIARKRDTTKPYECSESELQFDVDFYILSKLEPNLLEELEESEEFQFDFHRDPFLKPTGLGCYDKDGHSFGEGKILNAASSQFSAEYVSSNGDRGLSYVAYDGYRELLRIDRDGRKSVYDLSRRMSYHTNEFDSMKELTDSVEGSKSCISLEIGDATMKRAMMMERLIGIGTFGQTAAYYLGSKLMDGVTYEVYETELYFDKPQGLKAYNLPILLEAVKFLLPTYDTTSMKRFFVTYYVIELPDSVELRLYRQNDPIGSTTTSNLTFVPKLIELWELDEKSRKKKLANVLEFTEFNWSLDVEPSGDPESQDLSRLFNIESCVNERSEQLQVRFRINQESDSAVIGDKMLAAFKSSGSIIREILHERIANLLEIPRINLAHLDIVFADKSANLMVDSRIVELGSGISSDHLLGYAYFSEMVKNYSQSVLAIHMNRHSLDSCKLDSVSERRKNLLIYCKGLTVCILIDEAVKDNLHTLYQVERVHDTHSANATETMCELHLFSWAMKPVDQRTSIIAQVNKYKIKYAQFEFKFSYQTEANYTGLVKYKGRNENVELRFVDSTGFLSGGSPLVGLRFTTKSEESDSQNMNRMIEADFANRDDKFRYCHMACQLDEYCESFSICLRKQKQPTQESDCILSTLSLDSEVIDQIATLDSNMSLTEKSRVYKFRRDSECNLHPRDIMSSYSILKSLKKHSGSGVAEKIEGKIATLEECASLCHQTSLSTNLINATFAYCPLSSLCVLDYKSHDSLPDSQLCYVYSRDHLQFYNGIRLQRLMVVVDEKSDPSTKDKQTVEKNSISRTIEGLTREDCARDCNLHRSNCLAFDSCRISGNLVCVLHSIRSPNSSKSRKGGLLPQERQFYEKTSVNRPQTGSIMLVTSYDCNHYELKDMYFDIRLQQMLSASSDYLDNDINQSEQLLIDDDQRKGDKFIESNLERGAENNPEVKSIESTSGGLHLVLFFIGLISGSVVCLYGDKGLVYFLDLWETIKVRRSRRFGDHRISQVDLANNLEL